MAWIEDRWWVTRKNPDGSFTREKSPRYELGLRWRVRYEDPDGRDRARSFARKEDAEQFKTRIAADLLQGTYLDPAAGKITLRRYAEDWLENQTFDDATREVVANRVRRICEGLGGKRLVQLAGSPSAVQAWLKGQEGAPSTIRGCLHTLSTICAAAVDDGRMARNPCKSRSVRAPRDDERKVRPLPPVKLVALREALPQRWRAMADAGASCGLRQGEIFALSPDDVDFLRRVVHVRRQVKIIGSGQFFARPKRGKIRDVPLSDSAAVAFSEHIRSFPPVEVTLPWHQPGNRRHGKPEKVALMFTTPRARGAVRRQRFNRGAWKAALREAGIPDDRENGMHVLRHTYASVLIEAGVSIRRVAQYLGHTDPAFTLRVYGHLMEDGEDAARKAADRAFAVPSPSPAIVNTQ